MTIKSELGKRGEDLACEYLINKGYKVLDRNYRKPWGEIDVIARAPDKTLVFVEVKTMIGYKRERNDDNNNDHNNDPRNNDHDNNNDKLMPEDQLTASKLGKLQKTAQLYTGHYPEKVSEKGWRIDLLAIRVNYDNDHDIDKKANAPEVKHYEN